MEILIIGCVAAVGLTLKGAQLAFENHQFNNGIHRNCGGKWKYVDTYPAAGDSYIYGYRCDKCGADLSCGFNHGTDK